MPSFTDAAIRALPEGLHFDGKTPSFGIRVGKTRRTWIVIKGANRTKVSLGHYPVMSLQDARKRALVALGSPVEKKSTVTFPEALAAFLAQPRWRPGSKRVIQSSLKHFPWKGQVAKITHEQVIEALEGIEGRSARAHALKDIRTFFNWCVPRYLPSSPAVGIKMEAQATRDRILTDEELVKVWRAAEQIGYPFGTIVMLLILTGQRRSEIGSLKWDYIKNDRITLPAAATKNAREHTFPIGAVCAALLTRHSIPTTSGMQVWLFPARGSSSKPFNGWSKSHAALLKLSGTSGWTLHDLRRTFATNLAALNVPIHVTEKLLNHVSGSISGVAAIYNRHTYFGEMREALELWENHLQTLLSS